MDETSNLLSNHRSPSSNAGRFLYFTFVLQGAGLLVSWNSLVLAFDYFRALYPDFHSEYAIPFTDLLFAMLAVTVSIALVKRVHLYARISFGYVVIIFVLLAMIGLDYLIHYHEVHTILGYALTLFLVALVAFGTGVLESSYYGLTSLLMSDGFYSNALVVGGSLSGVVVSIVRIVTKVSTHSERIGVLYFFGFSSVYMIGCFMLALSLFHKSHFINYHVKESLNTSVKNVKNQISIQDGELNTDTTVHSRSTSCHCLTDILSSLKEVWMIVFAVFTTFFVTLLLFPGVTSDVQNCGLKDWPPVITGTVFNVFNSISRLTALRFHAVPNKWVLVILSIVRFATLSPLMILTVSPSPGDPVLPYPAWIGIGLTGVLGASGGWMAAVCMMIGPSLVSKELREVTGNIIILFVHLGLAAGSIGAFGLTELTNLQHNNPCNFTN